MATAPTQPLDEQYARLARRFARAGVCVEMNTGGLRKPVGEIYPHPELLRAMCTARVPVTLGSDAHAPGEVAAEFEASVALLREVGYASYTRFAQRARTHVAL